MLVYKLTLKKKEIVESYLKSNQTEDKGRRSSMVTH